MPFLTSKKVVENAPDTDYPAPLGDPGSHFDFPYQVVTDDANSITPVNADGVPMPISYQSVMPASPETDPFNVGAYQLQFMDAPAITPSMTQLNPAPGSVNLEQPMDTPFFAPGTNRIIHSKGPVTGTYVERYDGDRAEIGSIPAGQGGPVTGGPDYAQQLALTFQAAQNIAYSQQAAAQALVSSV